MKQNLYQEKKYDYAVIVDDEEEEQMNNVVSEKLSKKVRQT